MPPQLQAGAWLECMGGAVCCVTMRTRGEAYINGSATASGSSSPALTQDKTSFVHGVLLAVEAS